MNRTGLLVLSAALVCATVTAALAQGRPGSLMDTASKKALVRALLLERIDGLALDGRPPADPIPGLLVPHAKPSDRDELARFSTFSESVAYWLKVLVTASRTGTIPRELAKEKFSAILEWGRRHLQYGGFDHVYDADRAMQVRLDEDPDWAALAGRLAGCFAWRFIPGIGVVRSAKDYSAEGWDVASDADIEIASSLLLASQEFGDSSYVDEARRVVRCVASNLVAVQEAAGTCMSVLAAGTRLHCLGCVPVGCRSKRCARTGTNPSYYLFKDLALLAETFVGDPAGALMNEVRADAWTILLMATSGANRSGLPPNWLEVGMSDDGVAFVAPLRWQVKDYLSDASFGWDAVRVLLRTREARLAGVDIEGSDKYLSGPGEAACRCLLSLWEADGTLPQVVAPGCRVLDTGDSVPMWLAARALLLDTGRLEQAAHAEQKILDQVSCIDPSESPPFGCTRARLGADRAMAYYPTMLVLLAFLAELDAEK